MTRDLVRGEDPYRVFAGNKKRDRAYRQLRELGHTCLDLPTPHWYCRGCFSGRDEDGDVRPRTMEAAYFALSKKVKLCIYQAHRC